MSLEKGTNFPVMMVQFLSVIKSALADFFMEPVLSNLGLRELPRFNRFSDCCMFYMDFKRMNRVDA